MQDTQISMTNEPIDELAPPETDEILPCLSVQFVFGVDVTCVCVCVRWCRVLQCGQLVA